MCYLYMYVFGGVMILCVDDPSMYITQYYT